MFIVDKNISTITSKYINPTTGILTVDAIIARTGVQDYHSSELGLEGDYIVGVYRPEKEVFAQDSIDTFVNVPVTDNHPNDLVTIDNYNNFAKGSISNVNVIQLEGKKALSTKLSVTDKMLIDAIFDGKKELSVGYTNILQQQDGEFEGKKYSYIQTNIVANHVAIVDAGRCGDLCKLQLDSKLKTGVNDMTIKIGGTEYDVPEAVAKHIEGLTTKSADMEEEKEAMDSKLTKVKAELDVAKSKKVNDNDISKMVNDRVELLKMADKLGDKVICKPCMDNLTIKKIIVDSFEGLTSDGKSESYLDAIIDVKKTETIDKEQRKQEALDSHNQANGGGNPIKTIDYNSIEDKEI